MVEPFRDENPTTAKVKMLKASEFASMVEDLERDLREENDVGYRRFFSLLRGLHDSSTIRGWVEVFQWCQVNEDKDGLDYHPGRNRHIWERFLADLMVEVNTKFTEAKDMVSTVGWLVGPPTYIPRAMKSELKFKFARRGKKGA